MMSHELRTPLTSILAFSEILNSEGAPRDARETQVRQEIETNSRVLLLMINDILEMSRVDAGKTELSCEPVELGDVVGMVESVMRPLAEHNGIDFSCSIDADVPLIEADFEKIRHVVENLVGNAMKFTPEGGKVRVTVSYHPECEQAWICVADDGHRRGESRSGAHIRAIRAGRFIGIPQISGNGPGPCFGEGIRRDARRRHNARKQTGARVGVYGASTDSPSGKGGIATWPNRIK